jgi:FeS assembly SUF system regulator
MLRLSKLTDYGTVVMTHLARTGASILNATEIADQVHIAAPTVSKILKALAREGLVVSQRGVKGGYALARPPEEISVAEMVQALEGPIALTECNTETGLCSQEPCCSIRDNWQRINRVVREALDRVTLADMARPAQADQTGSRVPAPIERTRLHSKDGIKPESGL